MRVSSFADFSRVSHSTGQGVRAYNSGSCFAAASNPVLATTYSQINARLQALRFRSNQDEDKWRAAVQEHEQMLTALTQRDGPDVRVVRLDDPIDAVEECAEWDCFQDGEPDDELDEFFDGNSDLEPDESGRDLDRMFHSDPRDYGSPVPYVAPPKVGRNDPCPCGSGKKHKKCCINAGPI